MEFSHASTRLTACHTHEDIAGAVGVSRQSVRQARLDASLTGFRPAPEGWESAIASLARLRALDLLQLADELQPTSKRPLGVGRGVPWFANGIRDGNWIMLEVHNPDMAHENDHFPEDGVDLLVVPVPVRRLNRYRAAIRGILEAL